jgi:hypothetical protein
MVAECEYICFPSVSSITLSFFLSAFLTVTSKWYNWMACPII